jgi:DNA-binding NtrC family response regulator
MLAVEREARGLERLVVAPCPTQSVAFVVVGQEMSTRAAREAMRLGASEIVTGAAGEDAIVVAVDRAVRESRRLRELTMLRARVGDDAERTLIGRSSTIIRVRELVGHAAASRATVLVTGEPGTGKDAVARLVHDLSERSARPYVTLQCGDASPQELELELFGRASSSSEAPRAGLLENARGGTVVLEDAAALPVALRVQIANAIASCTTRRLGASTALPADVRLILTSRETDEDQAESHQELLRAFNATPIVLPPLRERRSDIPQLVQHFRRRFAAEHELELDPLSSEELLPLLANEWTGNVRELEHWVERTVVASRTERISPDANAKYAGIADVDFRAARVSLEELERAYILHVLQQESGHQSRAAVRLGIDRRTLYRKLKQYRAEGVELQRVG